SPVTFFALKGECHHLPKGKKVSSKHRLPDLSSLLCESPLATLYLGWNEEGLTVHIESDDWGERGDTLDLFFDTRDVKTSGFNTRFCHHFVVDPKERTVTEKTLFRTADSHPLTAPLPYKK